MVNSFQFPRQRRRWAAWLTFAEELLNGLSASAAHPPAWGVDHDNADFLRLRVCRHKETSYLSFTHRLNTIKT